MKSRFLHLGLRAGAVGLMLLLARAPADAQYLSVVDGYSAAFRFGISNLSFSQEPLPSNEWQLRYLSGTHLRLVDSGPVSISARVFSNVKPEPGGVVRLVPFKRSGDAPPWVAYYDGSLRKVRLTDPFREAGAESVPAITTRNFAVAATDRFGVRGVEWAATYGNFRPAETGTVFYFYDQGAWQVDSVDVIDERLRGLALGLGFDGGNTRSIATVTDSTVRVRVGAPGSWRMLDAPMTETRFYSLLGVKLADGSRVWNYGRLLYFQGDSLRVASAPLDSTLRSYDTRSFFADAAGNLHLLYRVVTRDGGVPLLHFFLQDDEWQVETVFELPPSRFLATLGTISDTLAIALADLNRGQILVYRKAGDGAWRPELVDRAGDLGSELSAAVSPDDYRHETAIAYYDRSHGDLKVAVGENPYGFEQPLRVQTVDTVGQVGLFPQAVLNGDSLHVFYLDASNGLLKHALQTPFDVNPGEWGPWQVSVLDSVIRTDLSLDLSQDADGGLHVAYERADPESIRVATWRGRAWQFESVAEARLQPPGEVSVFQTTDSLFVGYVSAGGLRLAAKGLPGDWYVQELPRAFDVSYATWTAANNGNLHVVYRVPRGFQDDIRHAVRNGGVWADATVVSTVAPGTFLRLKPVRMPGANVILAFVDDSRAQTYCYGGHDWFPIMQGTRFMSETAIDFTLTDLFTLTLFYRALNEPPQYSDPPLPDVVADVVVSIVDAVRATRTSRVATNFSHYPNPFNARTTIAYHVPVRGRVHIVVYNVMGERVTTLRDRIQPAGEYQVSFSGDGLASGLYLCRYDIAGEKGVDKMLLVK